MALPTAVVSASVAVLMEGVVQAMFWTKLKVATVLLMAGSIMALGGAFLHGVSSGQQVAAAMDPESPADRKAGQSAKKSDAPAPQVREQVPGTSTKTVEEKKEAAETDPKNTLTLFLNRSRIVTFENVPTRLQIGDRKLVDYEVLKPNQISLIGTQLGETVLNVWYADRNDPNRNFITSFLIRVILDPQEEARRDLWNAEKVPDVGSLVAFLNDNAARVQSLRCDDLDMVVTQGLQSFGLRGTLAAEKPRNFRLSARTLGNPVIDIGSSAEEFWYWFAKANPPHQFHSSYKDLREGRVRPLTFPPEWIMETLGMGHYGPSERYTLEHDRDTIKLVEKTTSPQGNKIRKVIVMKRLPAKPPNPQVIAYLLVDDVFGNELCSAHIAETHMDRQSGAILPCRIEYRWATDGQKSNLSLRLDGLSLKTAIPPETFTRPSAAGITSFNLATVRTATQKKFYKAFRGLDPSGFPYMFDLTSFGLLIAAQSMNLQADGRVRFEDCAVARFPRVQDDDEKEPVPVWTTTARSRFAIFTFENPVRNMADIGKNRILSMEFADGMRINLQDK